MARSTQPFHFGFLGGKIISGEILHEAANNVERQKKDGWTPRLVSIKIGDNPAVELYVRNQKKKAEKTGIVFIERHFPVGISLEEVRTAIFTYNVDPRITGIILQRPVPERLDAGFAALPSSTFRVDGSALDRDRLQLGLGVTGQLNENTTLNVAYIGELAGSDDNHQFAATVRFVW